MKCSALNVDFDGPCLDFLQAQGNLRTKTSKSGTHVKVVILPLLASLSSKRLQMHGMLPITISYSDPSFSVVSTSMTLKDSELPK